MLQQVLDLGSFVPLYLCINDTLPARARIREALALPCPGQRPMSMAAPILSCTDCSLIGFVLSWV
jgi:hypothetical protein